MAVTEVRPMTFIEYHNYTAVLDILKFAAVPGTSHSGIEFLDSRDYNL